MEAIEKKPNSGLRKNWRDEVVQILGRQGINITKSRVTDIKTQRIKNDPNEKIVLETILLVKKEHENKKKEKEKLLNAIKEL